MGYDFQIEYKVGKENVATDALSRSCYMAWSEPIYKLIKEIKQAQVANLMLSKILHGESAVANSMGNFSIKGNLLYMGDKLVVPKK